MFNSTSYVIDTCVDHLQQSYTHMYGQLEPEYSKILGWAGGMALELIANSDALYHNVEHTVMVTMLGQEILRGKHLREGGVTPSDWLSVVLALLCHDLGYVRGLCREDGMGTYTTGAPGQCVILVQSNNLNLLILKRLCAPSCPRKAMYRTMADDSGP